MKVAGLALALLGLAAFAAQDKKPRDNKDRQEFAGKIVCIGCTLAAQDGGANAECTLYAKHAQGLLMADGTLWTFVDNAKGHVIITNVKIENKTDTRGKEVKILGWKFPKAQYIEISRFQLKDGDKWVPYDYCKTCGFEANHDNKDTDLCEGCRK